MKPSLLLIHGALGSKVQLEHLRELLSSSFEVYAFNLPGHGGEALPETYAIDHFVEATDQFIQTLGLVRPGIFGYSMGGYIAMKLALDQPDLVGPIVTLGTKFQWDPESAAKEVRMMNPDIIEQKIPAFAATLRERHAPADWKTIMRLTGEMMTRMGNGEAMTGEDFKAITTRTLICIGSDDHMVTREESLKTADWLPQGTCQIIEGFRHPLESIDQEKMTEIIKVFIKR